MCCPLPRERARSEPFSEPVWPSGWRLVAAGSLNQRLWLQPDPCLSYSASAKWTVSWPVRLMSTWCAGERKALKQGYCACTRHHNNEQGIGLNIACALIFQGKGSVNLHRFPSRSTSMLRLSLYVLELYFTDPIEILEICIVVAPGLSLRYRSVPAQ